MIDSQPQRSLDSIDDSFTQTLRRPRKVRGPQQAEQPRRQPRYRVVLWDDNDHTVSYVVRMMRSLFGHTRQHGLEIADTVDRDGRAICLTTTLEHAELKRDQIHAFGEDNLADKCTGPMQSTIEPESDEG